MPWIGPGLLTPIPFVWYALGALFLLLFLPQLGILIDTSMLLKGIAIIQVLLAVLLTGAILIQQKGGGLGMAFGGSSNVFSTKRGIDKVLHQATIILSILFFGVSIARVLLS